MENLIVVGILLGLAGMAIFHIRREKRKGARCVGCPAAGCCHTKGCRINNKIKKTIDK